jgi:hypothetical protein
MIIIDGTAETRKALLDYRKALEKTEQFAKVHIPLSSLEKEVNVEFTISLTSQGE